MVKRRSTTKANAAAPPADPLLDIALDELIAVYTDPSAPQSSRIAAAVAALPFFHEPLPSDDDA